MEKRRTGVWLAAAAALSFRAWACDPGLEGTRLESARYVLTFKAGELPVAQHFALEVAACAKPGHPAPQSLKVDAHMPAHRHGMNYAPTIKALAPGRWRADGLMLHMPGRWEVVFEVRAGGITDRLANPVRISALLDF